MNVVQRLENLRNARLWQWGELAAALGVGDTMIHYLRTGKRPLSNKVARKLEELEVEAGIRPPPRVVHVVKEDSAVYSVESDNRNAATRKDIADLRKIIHELTEKLKEMERRL